MHEVASLGSPGDRGIMSEYFFEILCAKSCILGLLDSENGLCEPWLPLRHGPKVAAWRSCSVVGLDQRSYPTLSTVLVLGWVTVRVRLPGGTLFRYVTNHPGRLSLLPSVGR